MKGQILSFLLFLICFNLVGQDYFQQDVAYTIDVKLNDEKHTLTGNLSVDYTNNSSDELTFIWFHLWPNAYKTPHTALARQSLENGESELFYADSVNRGYISNLDFKVNGQKVKMEYHPEHIDICKIYLPEALKPDSKITISTPFFVKIPSGIYSRLGHIGQSYQITQWYPKPAVYDKNGWHEMPYLGLGEFYSEFGSYDVSITVPENYIVGATGDLQNKMEMKWLHIKSDETKALIEQGEFFTKGKKDLSFPPSSEKTKTLRYLQDKVHDFAWFTDKRYHVLHDTVTTPNSKSVVDCWTMFTNAEARLWAYSTDYIRDAVYYYSLWNGDYPYKHCTAVDGTISAGGGMEYPNITVIGSSGNAMMLETVIVHEVGHNWFYGILGSNERDHAWMDEGLNTLNENRYIETKYPNESLMDGLLALNENIERKFRLDIFNHKSTYELAYLLNARRNYDQPIELTSAEYTPTNYGGIVYSKTGIVFDYLKAYLGEDLFDQCMQTYFDRWKFKHPQPEDLKAVIEEITGKELDWFFNDLITTTKGLDFKIKSAKVGEWDDYKVKVKSAGEINGAFCLSGVVGDSVVAMQWYDSIPSDGNVYFRQGAYDKLVIDPFWDIPELTRTNNHLKTKGLLKKFEPLRLQFLGGIEDPYKSTLYWLPAAGWNQYDGFMAGLGFYNSLFPRKRLEFAAAPMFGFKSKTFTGLGNVAYNFRMKSASKFQNIRLEVDGRRFSFAEDNAVSPASSYGYQRFRSSLKFEIKRKRLRYSPVQKIELRHITAFTDNQPVIDQYADLSYSIVKTLPRYAVSGTATFQYGEYNSDKSFSMAMIAINNHLKYNQLGSEVRLRTFFSVLPGERNVSPSRSAHLSSVSGEADYTFDNYYLGRFESNPNFLSQQMTMGQGGFKIFTPIVSDDWMLAFNGEIDLPIPVGISLFADLGLYPTINIDPAGNRTKNIDNAYDLGLSIQVMNGLLKFHFPVVYSDQFTSYFETNNWTYGQRIRFELNLLKLNPFKLIDSINP